MLMLKAQTGPVFLTYRRRAEIDEQVAAAINAEPLFDLTAADGVRHTIWRLEQTDALAKSFESVPLLYIADGHHRAASASRARAELKEQSFAHTGKEDYNYFLTVIFPDSQVRILAYNRTVHDPILGIKDIRTDKRVDFIGGLRGTKELERLVNEGKAAVAFSLYPTTVEELLMVSDANEIMPPKSTWFEPKLRDGLLIHTI